MNRIKAAISAARSVKDARYSDGRGMRGVAAQQRGEAKEFRRVARTGLPYRPPLERS